LDFHLCGVLLFVILQAAREVANTIAHSANRVFPNTLQLPVALYLCLQSFGPDTSSAACHQLYLG
jgi:hypothetical protein